MVRRRFVVIHCFIQSLLIPHPADRMQNISILKVESPWCLWGRVRLDSEGHHEDLQVRLNLHYHDVTLDTTPLKPCSILEGQLLLTSTCY
ncbi:unnamed protein product [Gadus morhua 'NCC']